MYGGIAEGKWSKPCKTGVANRVGEKDKKKPLKKSWLKLSKFDESSKVSDSDAQATSRKINMKKFKLRKIIKSVIKKKILKFPGEGWWDTLHKEEQR